MILTRLRLQHFARYCSTEFDRQLEDEVGFLSCGRWHLQPQSRRHSFKLFNFPLLRSHMAVVTIRDREIEDLRPLVNLLLSYTIIIDEVAQ